MSAVGIVWTVIVSILFTMILPITFCVLWKKGKAKPQTYDFDAYTTPSGTTSIND
jgi:hypothetical protein